MRRGVKPNSAFRSSMVVTVLHAVPRCTQLVVMRGFSSLDAIHPFVEWVSISCRL